MSSILIIIYILFFFAQVVLGIASWNMRKKLPRKYSHTLGEMVDPSRTLEIYRKEYKKLDLKATNQIKDPAFAEENLLLINKKNLYEKDLFSNFYVIFQLELTQPKRSFLRNIFMLQNIIFIAQNLVFIIGIATENQFSDIFLYISISIIVLLFLLTFYSSVSMDFLLLEALEKVAAILNLDNVEYARAEALSKDLKYQVFEYPFEILYRFWQFFKP
jgi:hypothetical protein